MANGIRERRQAGWKQDSGSLDALERILGIGEGIAGRVQANRDKRQAYNVRYMDSLMKGIDQNFSNSGPGGVQQILDKLSSYKDKNMGNATAETLELHDIAKMKAEAQMADNFDYSQKLDLMNKKQEEVQQWVLDSYNYQKAGDSEKKVIRARLGDEYIEDEEKWFLENEKKMRGLMNEFSKDYSGWYAKHQDRHDQLSVSRLLGSQDYMSSILEGWKDDNKIDEAEYKAYYDGVMHGNSEQLSAFVAKRNIGDVQKMESLYSDLETQRDEWNLIEKSLTEGQMTLEQMRGIFPKESGLLPSSDEVNAALMEQQLSATQQDATTHNLNVFQREYLQMIKPDKYKTIQKTNKGLIDLGQKDQILGDTIFAGMPGQPEVVVDSGAGGGDGSPPPEIIEKDDGTVMIYKPDHPQANEDGYVANRFITKKEPEIPTSQKIGADAGKGDYDKNISGIKDEKAHLKKPLGQLTAKYNNYKKLTDEIKLGGDGEHAGEGLYDTRSRWGYKGEYFKDWDLKGIDKVDMEKVYEWYYTTYPMNSGAGGYSYTGAVNRSVGHLREKFFNEDSSAPLSYDELLKMKKTYEEDTIAYEKVKQDMKALKDVGQGKSEAWNELRAKEKAYGEKYLGWGYSKTHSRYQENNSWTRARTHAKEELDKALSFYEVLMKDMLNKHAGNIDKVTAIVK